VFADNNPKIKHYEKRFGVIAIDKGFITVDDLAKGLTVQVNEDRKNMPHRLLGEVFFIWVLWRIRRSKKCSMRFSVKPPDFSGYHPTMLEGEIT